MAASPTLLWSGTLQGFGAFSITSEWCLTSLTPGERPLTRGTSDPSLRPLIAVERTHTC